MSSGIYQIKGPGGVYVGSSMNIWHRWKIHLDDLKTGAHCCIPLQAAWTKSRGSKEEIHFEILELIPNASEEVLEKREQYYMDINILNLYNKLKTAGRNKKKRIFKHDYGEPVNLEDPWEAKRQALAGSMELPFNKHRDGKSKPYLNRQKEAAAKAKRTWLA